LFQAVLHVKYNDRVAGGNNSVHMELMRWCDKSW